MTEPFLTRIRDLKLKQLLVFEEVINLGSTYKAAEALHMSQSNVVKLLHHLETLLEVPLFESHARGLTPTLYAERLAQRIKSMLGDTRALGKELYELRHGTRGHVTVGTLISASAHLLPNCIAALKHDYPAIKVSILESSNEVLFPKLVSGELDLVVGRLPEQLLLGISSHVLYQEQLLLVTGSRHLDLTEISIELSNLLNYLWILPLPTSPVRAKVEQFFLQHQLPLPSNYVESLSLLTNLGLLQTSKSLGFLPRAAAQPFIKAGLLITIPIEVRPSFGNIGYSLQTERLPTPATLHFIEALQKTAHQTLED